MHSYANFFNFVRIMKVQEKTCDGIIYTILKRQRILDDSIMWEED
jgi:hypothetical protein